MLTSALNRPSPDGGDAHFGHVPGNTVSAGPESPCRRPASTGAESQNIRS
jgi:hypothetical protein